ncbi:ergosterol biosynthetic protein 28 homolog isoform X3 [Corythoichthys intestinalis]|uniref:ergosterol biosynthetic protein 28 homolog isoform X3 n=1 Tax=Corythoichthys intestinalis TaxID=161448 RepID=UPI0025A57720|nr:ergosterol biosynthetic protein 28 homolog isoform X3 [Corythoichthys intestinalis]
MSRFLNVLRSWLVMVSVIAMGNTVQSFRDHSFLSEKLYTGTPEFVNGLQARTFGIWTLLSSIIRCACAIDIHNRTFFNSRDADWIPVFSRDSRGSGSAAEETELNVRAQSPKFPKPTPPAKSVKMNFCSRQYKVIF